MKKTAFISAMILSTTALASCGDSDGTNPYGETPKAGSRDASDPSTTAESIDLADHAGRWSTERGAVGEGARLVIDLTADGIVSIDVRAIENGNEAIMESSTGKASAQGSVIRGNVDAGEGVHGILKKYSTWTLDPKGTISGGQGTGPVRIAREER